MSALQMEAYEMMGQLSESKLKLIIEIMKNFNNSPTKTSDIKTSKRIGIAKGKFVVPDDIDECNEEIAEMFGVNV